MDLTRPTGEPVIINKTPTHDGRPAVTINIGTATAHRCAMGIDRTWRTSNTDPACTKTPRLRNWSAAQTPPSSS